MKRVDCQNAQHTCESPCERMVLSQGVGREPWERGAVRPNQASVASHTRLHRELISFLRQHSAFCAKRHLVLLAWMVAGLLLSQTVCFDRWKSVLPLDHCRAASWQRRCRRWLSNVRIDVEAIYGPLIQGRCSSGKARPGQHLALVTTLLWNRCCVVVLSVVAHRRAIPLV